ncbi:XrtA-associated tyrosine autokinase [Azohydromonas sediminis]|uniref:XrtA-associated tyrosine autokinase n=1 Tax=Azohydromonas sediminis TaxID=2259674 RepID=UPI000E650272|nr:XrtA-associated tyrosine autokinase [Azohydromonas sediminis]
MSSLIEKAAQRLAQLRAAGVEVPEPAPIAAAGASAVAAPPPAAPAVTSRRVELDLDLLARNGIVTPNAPRSRLGDQFRVIKRPLLHNASGKGASTINHANLIMITSALPGEGKTFTALNLAMSIATELDHTVMLVDADVARPAVLKNLGLPEGPGLLDLIDGSVQMHEALLRTNVDKLTLLPSGTPHQRATEMLASEGMRRLLDDIANRYPDRIVIFDSPPLLLTTESRVLATNMGQIVIVVQAGRTKQSDVQAALDTIEACPVRLMLLNQVRSEPEAAYGYGYGYGYGHGRGGEPKPAT